MLVTNGNTGTPSTDAMIHATFGSGVEKLRYGYESAMRQESLVRQEAVNSIVRVYPDANVQTLLSHNQDMVSAMKKLGAQICAINLQGTNDNTDSYLQFFSQRAFVPST